MIAYDLRQCAKDRFPDNLRRILRALFVKDHHVIEHWLNVTLVGAFSRARFHRHFERSLLECETAMRLGEFI